MGVSTKYLLSREQQMARELDPFKKIVPLDWGLDCVGLPVDCPNPLAALGEFVRRQTADSERFYACPASSEPVLCDRRLSYRSPIQTHEEANNVAVWQFYKGRRRDRAVLLFPHWNASATALDRFASLLCLSGFSVLRMTMPYHGERNVPGASLADGMVSSNIGRTIRSSRQAVLEAKLAIEWLEKRGYSKIGLVGVSLGSSIAFLVAAHDLRVRAACYMLLASNFGEVVWTGTATAHIRQGLERHISREELRFLWSLISPITFVSHLRDRPLQTYVISAKHDGVFIPPLTQEILGALHDHGVHHRSTLLNCGHYTAGMFPFSAMNLALVIRFLRRALN